jgi:short-subunit dehydrogenase
MLHKQAKAIMVLDAIVFGATGFTGERVAKYWATVQQKKESRPWGIAGRQRGKLEAVRKQIPEGHAPEVVIADCSQYDSILNMAKNCKVVINCVGPVNSFAFVYLIFDIFQSFVFMEKWLCELVLKLEHIMLMLLESQSSWREWF